MSIATTLRPLDDETLESLLSVAVAEATPEEVMPVVDGPPGWTPARIAAFRKFHRDRLPGLDGPLRTIMFAVLADAEVVGMIRMSRLDEPGAVQTGMWLGRSARGLGVGSSALRRLIDEAARVGARAVVAETTGANVGAVRALRRCGARLAYSDPFAGAAPGLADESTQVRAVIAIPTPPPAGPAH